MGEADAVVGISRDELRAGLPTPGMRREEAIATETTWAGLAHTEAGMVSGWHHHGDYESVIYVLTGRSRVVRSIERATRQTTKEPRSSCARDGVIPS